MNKKVLITLLSATASGVAFANVNVTDQIGDWSFKGVPGAGSTTEKLDLLVPNLAGGEASQTISNLPQGKYKLTWDSEKNVTVKVNGTAVTNGEAFDLTEGQDLTITIGPADEAVNNGGYQISNIKLEIVCNPGAFRTDLLAAIEDAKTSFASLNKNVSDAIKANYEESKAAIVKELEDLAQKANTIPNVDVVTLSDYTANKYWNLQEDYYTNGFNPINEKIKAYNDGVELENAKADFKVAATTAAEEAKKQVEEQASLAALIKEANENQQAEWINKQIKDALADIQQKETALLNSINSLGNTDCNDAADMDAVATANEELKKQIAEVTEAIADYLTDFASFKAQYDQVLNTANNYNAIWVEAGSAEVPSVKYLEQAVADARKQLFKLDGAYVPIQQQANEKIDKIFEDTKAALTIKEGKVETGTDGNFTTDQANLKQALSDIKDAVDVALQTLDGPYGDIAEQINALTGRSNTSLANVRPTDKDDLAAQKSVIDEKIAAIQSAAEAALADGTITAGMFDDQISEIDTLLKAYEAAIGDSEAFTKAYKDNDNYLKGYLNGNNGIDTVWQGWIATENKEIKDHPEWWITSNASFEGSKNNIEAFINEQIAKNDSIYNETQDAITPISDGVKSTIETSVTSFTDTGNLIINAIIEVGADAVKFNNYATAIGIVLNNKTAYDGNKTTYQTELTRIENLITNLSGDLSAAVSIQGDGQAIYDGVVAVKNKYKDVNFQTDLNNLLSNIEQGITSANKTYILNALTADNTTLDELNGAPGTESIKNFINDVLSPKINAVGIPAEPANIKATDDINKYADSFEDADTAIGWVYGYLTNVDVAIESCKTNVNNYNANVTSISGVQTNLETLNDKVKEYDEGAYNTSYKGLIDAQQTAISALTTTNNKAYEAFKVEITENTVTKEDGTVVKTGEYTIKTGSVVSKGLNDKINNVNQDIAKTEEKIDQNEANYQLLVNLSVDKCTTLTGYIEVINAHIVAGSVEAPSLAKQMQSLLSQLYNYNGTIYEAYTKMFPQDTTYAIIEGQINDWVNQAKDLMAQLNSEVLAYNNGIFDTAWENNTEYGYKGVYSTYTSTISNFDEYKDVTNAGFLAFEYNGEKVSDILDSAHAELFAYYDSIRQLNNDAEALLTALNSYIPEGSDYVGQTITDQFDLGTAVQYDAEHKHIVSGFLTQAATYKAEIEQKFTEFANKINGAAEAYYTYLCGEKSQLLKDAKAKLISAGALEKEVDAALSELNGIYAKAEDAYKDATDPEKFVNPELAKSMGTICGYLDQINDENIGTATYQIALTLWTEAYDQAKANATVEFPTIPEGYDEIDQSSYNEAFAMLAELNDKATNDPTLWKDLADLINQLNVAAENAKTIGDDLIKNWKSNYADELLYDDFMPKGKDELYSMYNTLAEYVLPLAGSLDQIDKLDNIKALIDKLVEDVKNCEGYATQVFGDVTDYKDSNRYLNIINAINNEYVEAYNSEILFLKSNVAAVKAGFNSVVADGKVDQSTANTFWDGIDELSNKIDKLTPATTPEEAQGENIKNILSLQNQLADYQVTLDTYLDVDNIGTVVAALEDAYSPVVDQLTELQYQLEGCLDSVKEEYSSKVDDLNKQLEEVYALINPDDPATLYQQANIENQLKTISTKIENLSEEIADAQNKAEEKIELQARNEALFTTLTDKLGEIETDLDLMVDESTFFNYEASSYINSVNYYIQSQTETLDYYKEQLTLINRYNENSLDQAVANKCYDINLNRVSRSFDKTNSLCSKAIEAANAAFDAIEIYNETYPSQAGRFEGELADIISALAVLPTPEELAAQKLKVEHETTIDEVTAYVNSLKDIYTQAKALYDAAIELQDYVELNSVLLGDLNSDNKVTITDVVKLLNLILGNTPYDETVKAHIAADINGNKKLDTSDIQSILNIIYGSQAKALTMQRMAPKPANISVAAERIAVAGDAQSFAINMSTDTQLVGGMIDLVLADGMEITSIVPTERLQDLEFFTNDLGNGVTRVVFICTTETHTISGTDGAIFNVEVSGSGNISMDNVEFTNSQAHLYNIGAVSNPSGIESLWNDVQAFGRKIYNVSGQMINRLQRGINIIINSDGSSSKTLKK